MTAALLDTLGIEKVDCVLGYSGGGLAAYNFAARYPNRLKTLVVESGVSGDWIHHRIAELRQKSCNMLKFGVTNTTINRIMLHKAITDPASLTYALVGNLSDYNADELTQHSAEVATDPEKLDFIRCLIKTQATMSVYDNNWEMMVADCENFAATVPLENITVPTLICHGKRDGDVPYAMAENAHRRITGSELYTLDQGHHIPRLDKEGNAMT